MCSPPPSPPPSHTQLPAEVVLHMFVIILGALRRLVQLVEERRVVPSVEVAILGHQVHAAHLDSDLQTGSARPHEQEALLVVGDVHGRLQGNHVYQTLQEDVRRVRHGDAETVYSGKTRKKKYFYKKG